MTSKDDIIRAIKNFAEKHDRTPGRRLFERETSIRQPEWYGVYWRSWGDAILEAGLDPNQKQGKLSSEDVLVKYADAVRHFGRIPAEIDLRMYAKERNNFPGHTTFTNHFGNKAGILAALHKFACENANYTDILKILPAPQPEEAPNEQIEEGYVYLLKSGQYYKIGRSSELERRIKQISIALPEEVTLEHAIRTDDPAGIEAYWHRRFDTRRVRGEWFQLSSSDLRAFKRRKFQ